MNSAEKKKKKISEYTFEDIKKFFSENLKKISSAIILIEIGNDFLNIGLAKSKNNRLYIKKVFRQILPKEALEKSIPSDPISFGVFLNEIINENKIKTNRVALSLSSDACYTRLIEIPEEVEENDVFDTYIICWSLCSGLVPETEKTRRYKKEIFFMENWIHTNFIISNFFNRDGQTSLDWGCNNSCYSYFGFPI